MSARKWVESLLRVATGWVPGLGDAVEESLKRWEEHRRAKAARTTLLDVENRQWRPDISPAALLRADFGVVPFHGRQQELDNLSEWCEGTGDARKLPSGETPPVALRLYTAPGGYGKTRLLRHFARWRRRWGWEAGFLGEGKLAEVCGAEGGRGGTEALFGEATKSLLLVLDYAESRRAEVEAVVATARESRRHRVRLVLLARSDGDWWEQLRRAGDGVGDFFQGPAVEGPLPLAPLTDSTETRQEVFEKASAAFAEQLGKPVPDARLLLDGEDFKRVLMIHAAALAAVEGEAIPTGGLLGWLLSREERSLERVREKYSGLGKALQPAIAQAAALLTLAEGAGSSTETMEILSRVPDLGEQSRARRKQLAEALHVLYRGRRWCDGVEPDLVGEHLVRRELEAAPTLLEAAFGPEVPEESLESGLLVLNRLAQRQPKARSLLRRAFQGRLPQLALPAVRTALADGDPIGQVLAETLEASGADEVASQLAAHIPEATTALREAGVIVTRVRLERLRKQIGEQPSEEEKQGMAGLANDLSNRLATLGRSEDALTASQKAVDIYRRLVEQRPNVFLPKLAMSLSNLSLHLGDLGRREDALTAIQEAVVIRRGLAEQQPDAFVLDLANSLNSLSVHLSRLGRREEALAASQEAVDIYRRFAKQRPEALLPDLAANLNTLSIRFAEMGRREDGLAAIQEAVDIYRRLAEKRPDAVLPNLASSINNLSVALWNLGRREDGLAAIQEAADIRRQLAEQRPAAFNPDLAMSLSNLAVYFADLGRREDGLTAIQEAVDIYRRLAEQRSDAFLPELARSLLVLHDRLAEEDQPAALAAIREALDHLEPFFRRHPAAFAPLMTETIEEYEQTAEACGEEPDRARLEAIREILQQVQEGE